METHCLPDRKSRGKLLEKQVRILGTGNVFLYGIIYKPWCKWAHPPSTSLGKTGREHAAPKADASGLIYGKKG